MKRPSRSVVLQRDNNRCTECGKSDIKLDIHHTIPVRAGGSHSLQNLRTLCRRCHKNLEPVGKYDLKPSESHIIHVKTKTYNKLVKLGTVSDTFDSVIQRLIKKSIRRDNQK